MTTALVILDMLNDFVDGRLANEAAKEIIEPIASLADQARQHEGWIVVYGNDAHQPGDFELNVFGEHAMAGTPVPTSSTHSRPRPETSSSPSVYYSAFTATDLDIICRVHQVERMVIVGQRTDCCCRHTSYDAFQLSWGIELVAVADVTAVYEPLSEEPVKRRQHAALDYLKTYYNAEVLPSHEVF